MVPISSPLGTVPQADADAVGLSSMLIDGGNMVDARLMAACMHYAFQLARVNLMRRPGSPSIGNRVIFLPLVTMAHHPPRRYLK